MENNVLEKSQKKYKIEYHQQDLDKLTEVINKIENDIKNGDISGLSKLQSLYIELEKKKRLIKNYNYQLKWKEEHKDKVEIYGKKSYGKSYYERHREELLKKQKEKNAEARRILNRVKEANFLEHLKEIEKINGEQTVEN
jgi:hypothetical protein